MKSNKIAKVIFLGYSAVGKTALIRRITQNIFSYNNLSTIGSNYFTKVHINEEKSLQIRIHFWDIAGQEKQRSVIQSQIHGVNIIIFCGENENTFQSIKNFWYKECEKLLKSSNCLKILVKTKSDKRLENDENLIEEMKEYSKTIGAMFFETSALLDINIDSLFNFICIQCESLNLKDDNAKIYLNLKEKEGEGEGKRCIC